MPKRLLHVVCLRRWIRAIAREPSIARARRRSQRRILLWALASHLISLATLLPPLQASPDAGHGMFVGASVGRILEVTGGEPGLRPTGESFGVEAGWLIPGGSTFSVELGVLGIVSIPAGPSEARADRLSSLAGGFGGLRVAPAGDPATQWGSVLRAGIDVGLARRAESSGGAGVRPWLGPRFALGFERELWFGTTVSIGAEGHAGIAPVSLVLGFGASLVTQALP